MMNQTQAKDLIHFHGVNLLVATYEGREYVKLKPIVEMLSKQWKSARETAFSDENVKLLGTCELNQPEIDVFGTTSGTKNAVYILLEATEGYIFSTCTSHMRAKGNSAGADYVLNLKKEWQRVLHDYETKGVVYKNKAAADLKNYTELRNKTHIGIEKQYYTNLINQCFLELGADVVKKNSDDPQEALDVTESQG